MFTYFFIFLIFFSTGSSLLLAPKGCAPFGTRLALGRKYFRSSDSQILSVRFNTQLECNKSFVTIIKESTIKKVYCQSKKISFDNYTSHIQKCSIDFLLKGDTYEYMAFGWSGKNDESAIPYKNSNLKTHLIKETQSIKMVVLADWGYLQQKVDIYDKLDNAFNALLKQVDQPDVVYLGGDYAYDLSTNYGKNYQSFLIMLSQIAATWPCIFITGNHEYYTPNDFILFNQSFQLYDLTKENVTSLDLGGFYLVLADPYQILYENATSQKLLAKFKTQMDKAPKNRPLIVSTHYPLACSGASTHCRNQRFILKQFFEMMIDYDTTFYIGAHYHTYQRLYPYIKGGDFKLIQGPYNLTKKSKYLVSVVEGIAGNDKSIVQQYGKLQNFTAVLSYNKTGYGVMCTNGRILKYQHFISSDWAKPVDSLTIEFEGILSQSRMYLREE